MKVVSSETSHHPQVLQCIFSVNKDVLKTIQPPKSETNTDILLSFNAYIQVSVVVSVMSFIAKRSNSESNSCHVS